jgi:hypothetical protein
MNPSILTKAAKRGQGPSQILHFSEKIFRWTDDGVGNTVPEIVRQAGEEMKRAFLPGRKRKPRSLK